jgi:hypothetical protein
MLCQILRGTHGRYPKLGPGCSDWRDRDWRVFHHPPIAAVALIPLGTSLPTACNVEGQSRLARTLSSGHVVGHNNPDPRLETGNRPWARQHQPRLPHTAPFGCEEFLLCLRH